MTERSTFNPETILASTPDADAHLNECLRIHDELVYIIECLMQELTGEAKGAFHDLHLAIDAAVSLPSSVRQEFHEKATNFRERLVWPAGDPQLRFDIANLRRRIFNAIAALRGLDGYNSAEALVVS